MAEGHAAARSTLPADGAQAQGAHLIRLESSTGYGTALIEVLKRIESEFRNYDKKALPIRMVIAGGAALFLHTGERVTEDVDATFSRRVLLNDIEVAYRDPDGRAAIIYLDRNYNDTLGLLHEDADDDAERVELNEIDRKVLDVRVLTPIDLAVSKLGRFSDQDREDILLLAERGLIDAKNLRKRAGEALKAYVGNLESTQNTIDIACRLLENQASRRKPSGSR